MPEKRRKKPQAVSGVKTVIAKTLIGSLLGAVMFFVLTALASLILWKTDADESIYNTVGITEELLQEEFNTMVNKVSNNKGFWVGRYETSNMNGGSSTKDNSYDATQQIEVVKGATEGVSGGNINWYRMYAQQKNYSKLALGETMTSSMMWESQWEQIMLWMKEVRNEPQNSYYVINAIGMGNYGTVSGVDDGYSDTSAPAETGCFKVKNIYDLAGNVYDFVLSGGQSVKDNVQTRGRVGGRFDDTDILYMKGHFHNVIGPHNTSASYGSRATLY